MKHDQFTLFFSPSYLTQWDSMEQPSVVIDYEWEDIGTFAVKYICFEPDVIMNLKPTSKFDLLEEINQCVYQNVVDYYTEKNESFMDTLERVGVKRKEVEA